MNSIWQPDIAFLGAGGNKPRVEAISAETGETWKLVEFPPEHSAYALDLSSEDGSLAIGTKGGLIYIVASVQDRKTFKPAKPIELIQGRPVLSVCWVSKSLLAVSDTAGRCLLWHIDKESPLQPLETSEGVICCLLNVGDGMLVGLSSEGKLLFWQISLAKLVRQIDVSSPPPISALVRMVYWPVKRVLACPGTGGCLSLYDLENSKLMTLQAHEGVFYAISVWNDSIITVGLEDRRLKIWQSASGKPAYDFQVPDAVTSAGVSGGVPTKVLLVGTQGTVRRYTLKAGKLELINSLPGEDYRAVATPDPEKLKAFFLEQKENEVRQIATFIKENMNQATEQDIEGRHARLIDLGYEHISLPLRVEQADQKGDIVEGLKFCSSLMGIIQQNHPMACPSMERYAGLLERAWQISEADALCRRILAINPDYPFMIKPDNLSQIVKLFEETNWVLQTDIIIEKLIDSATVIGKHFYGRYVINILEPDICEWVKLSPDLIANKYEEVRKKFGEGDLPMAKVEKVWWFHPDEKFEMEIITFGNHSQNGVTGLQFALQVLCSDLTTEVYPVVLFDWRDIRQDLSIELENERASKVLSGLRKNDRINSYLTEVHKVLNHALQPLVTERLSQRKFKK